MVAQLVLASAGAGMTVQPAPARTTDRDVETLIARLAQNAEDFGRSLADEPGREWAIGWEKEQNINHFIAAFVQSTRGLRDQYGRDQVVAARVDDVLRRGVSVDSFMERYRSPDRSLARARGEPEWAAVRRDLEALARAYGVPWHDARPLFTGLSDVLPCYDSFIHLS